MPALVPNTINRDLSWLSFNERVLQEAQNLNVPLVERLRFLGIYSNNLDEFFRVRVATNMRLKSALKTTNPKLSSYYKKTLSEIQSKVIQLQNSFHATYDQIIGELKTQNIFITNEHEFSEEQAKIVRRYFVDEVESLITPIILNNIKKFPYLKDNSVYLFIVLTRKSGKAVRAFIELPTDYISRFLVIPDVVNKSKSIVFIDDIIRYNLKYVLSIFSPVSIESHTIKLTRDAALDLDDDFSQSYFNKVEKSLDRRKKGKIVRFVHDRDIKQENLNYILENLGISKTESIIAGSRYHNSRDFIGFPDIQVPELMFNRISPLEHCALTEERPLIKQVQDKDILFQFPYHSFDYLIDIIREASIDPKVVSIKISLYRLAKKSKVIKALKNAARNGKDVEVIIELRARFDEEANLDWSKQLQDENINVRLGIQGLKVHSKILLIQRKSKGELKNLAFISTGNFHEKTSNIYCDTALFTANPVITNEIEQVFGIFDKPYLPYSFNNLLVSPVNLRKRIESFIDRETNNAKNGEKGFIFIKVNNLVDDVIIKKLREAGEAGVEVKLLARGVCSMLPSKNIEIRSIVGRYLEHSRVFYFGNNGSSDVYIGSADLMTRNLDIRVEVLTPILDVDIKKQLIDYLNLQWSDNQKARIIDVNVANEFVKNGSTPIDSQMAMYNFLSKS